MGRAALPNSRVELRTEALLGLPHPVTFSQMMGAAPQSIPKTLAGMGVDGGTLEIQGCFRPTRATREGVLYLPRSLPCPQRKHFSWTIPTLGVMELFWDGIPHPGRLS
jgi:hypothetical protein